MKKIFLAAASIAVLSFLATGCELLQSTLSSYQEEAKEEAVGVISAASTTYYYNGDSSTDMTSCTDALKLNLSQKGKYGSDGMSAVYTIKYTDSDGNTIQKTKTVTTPSDIGSFSKDKTEFKLSLSPVYAELNGTDVSGGTAAVTVVLTGIANAETNEAMGKFTKTFKITPLYSNTSAVYATTSSTLSSVDFKLDTDSGAEFDILPDVTIVSNDSTASNLTGFTATYSEGVLSLTPVLSSGTLSETSGSVTVKVDGLSIADEYFDSSIFTVNLKYAIVITDTADDAVVEDASWGTQALDINTVTLSNDNDNLEVTLAGSFALVTWNSRFVIMIDKSSDDEPDMSLVSAVPCTDPSYTNGQADVYFYHKPATSGTSTLTYEAGLYAKGDSDESWGLVESESGNASSTVTGTSFEIDNANAVVSSGTVTYKLNLDAMGINAGDTVKVFVVAVADWNAGVYAADVAPDLTTMNSIGTSGGSADFNFNEAISYTVK